MGCPGTSGRDGIDHQYSKDGQDDYDDDDEEFDEEAPRDAL